MGYGLGKLQSVLPVTAESWHGIEIIFRFNKIGFSLNERTPLFQRSKYTGPLDVDNIFYIGGTDSTSDATPEYVGL